MGARVSAKGVTKYGFGASDPTVVTAQEAESAKVQAKGKGMAAPPPARDYPAGQGGRKVSSKGATKIKGGAI